jgi:uncharacterized protein YprB with RNaseH-like and TPR domain
MLLLMMVQKLMEELKNPNTDPAKKQEIYQKLISIENDLKQNAAAWSMEYSNSEGGPMVSQKNTNIVSNSYIRKAIANSGGANLLLLVAQEIKKAVEGGDPSAQENLKKIMKDIERK